MSMNRFRQIALVVASLMVPAQSFADRVVLRDASQVKGIVANREAFRAAKGAVDVVSLLPDSGDSDGIRRIARADIEYVILEEADGGRQVFDMSLAPKAETPKSVPNRERESGNGGGIALAVMGATAAIAGTVSESTDGKTRATLILGGTFLFVGGLVWASHGGRSNVSLSASPDGSARVAFTRAF
jgi:hypothetical protein